MANSNPKPLPSGISLGDITYVLFKHKWKIICFSLLCAAGAAAYYLKSDPPFVSQAKLMIPYLVTQSVEDDVRTKTDTESGRQMQGIIDGQLAILTSWDLAAMVAQNVAHVMVGLDEPKRGSDAIATQYTPEQEAKLQQAYRTLIGDAKVELPERTRNLTLALRNAAANALLLNLTASAERGTSVIQVAYRHRDEGIPARILSELIDMYKERHLEIHRPPPTSDALNSAADLALSAQEKTNGLLVSAMQNLSVASVAEGQELYGAGLATAYADARKAEADYAEQKTRVEMLEKAAGITPGTGADISDTGTNKSPAGQETPASPEAAPSSIPAPDSVLMNDYRSTLASLEMARQQHSVDSLKYAPGHEGLQAKSRLVKELEAKRMAMEKEHPELLAIAPAASLPQSSQASLELQTQRVELAALERRKNDAQARHTQLEAEAKKFNAILPNLLSLTQQLEVDRENYKQTQLQGQRWAMDAIMKSENSTPNIRDVQSPSPAVKDVKLRDRIALGLLIGGPVIGVGLVLVFGLLLNRTIKRPLEIEEGLGMPLMMSIPYFTKRQRMKSMRPLGAGKPTKALQEIESGRAPWEKSHFIQPFTEAVRDRLMMYFEATGNIRKPKLIAVTGYSVGAGTSTVAAGLASSLSEIGDGKVLLVDMSGHQGAAHPFFDGEPAVSITKALRLPGITNGAANGITKSEVAENRNLVVARADSPSSGITSIGLRRLMPELKASEFDYIVFDMPPLGQTKPTATVAGMMDKVLVVVEAETSTRSDVRRGYRDLVQAGANASVLFNKAKKHGPKALAGGVA